MNEDTPPSSKTTLRDIAKSLGVSHVTVSRALKDHFPVSPDLRARIREAAQRMGYQPNAMATALGVQRQGAQKPPSGATIAWINSRRDPEMLRRFREFDLYWRGACLTAQRCGYGLEEFRCHRSCTGARLAEILLARNIRGVLIPPHRATDLPDDWQQIPWSKFSVVRFSYSISAPAVHIVSANHVTNAFTAVENILNLGYRRIGLVTWKVTNTRDKAGFLMKQVELPTSQRVPPLILPNEANSQTVVSSLRNWFQKYRPDSILTPIREIRQMLTTIGLRVPEDIGFAAFSILDGDSDAGIFQNSERIGSAAAEFLISMINHNEIGVPAHPRELLIKGDWVNGSALPPVPQQSRKSPRLRSSR